MANLNKVMLIGNLTKNGAAIDKFWSKVDKQGPIHPYDSSKGVCWMWTASVDGGGYGQLRWLGRKHSPIKAHRFSFLVENGEIEMGLEVCHSCDNPRCVRPSHLFLGSHQQNMNDAAKKGRMRIASKVKHGESNGQAKLTYSDIPVILELRKNGLSQSMVAKKLGVSRSIISLIENKKKWRTAHGIIQ